GPSDTRFEGSHSTCRPPETTVKHASIRKKKLRRLTPNSNPKASSTQHRATTSPRSGSSQKSPESIMLREQYNPRSRSRTPGLLDRAPLGASSATNPSYRRQRRQSGERRPRPLPPRFPPLREEESEQREQPRCPEPWPRSAASSP